MNHQCETSTSTQMVLEVAVAGVERSVPPADAPKWPTNRIRCNQSDLTIRWELTSFDPSHPLVHELETTEFRKGMAWTQAYVLCCVPGNRVGGDGLPG